MSFFFPVFLNKSILLFFCKSITTVSTNGANIGLIDKNSLAHESNPISEYSIPFSASKIGSEPIKNPIVSPWIMKIE